MYSIAIPAYNEEDYIGDLLGYLSEQAPSSVDEIVVCDSLSTDNTAEIVRQWQQQEPRVKLVVAKRPGKAAAWNCLIENVHSPIVVFFDADVKPVADCLRRLLSAVESSDYLAYACRRRALQSGEGWRRRLLRFIANPGIELCLAGGGYAMRKDILLGRLDEQGFTEMPDVFAEDVWLQTFLKKDELCILNDCVIDFEVSSLEAYLRIHARKQLVWYELSKDYSELAQALWHNHPEAISSWWQARRVLSAPRPLADKIMWFFSGIVKRLVNLYFSRRINSYFAAYCEAYHNSGGGHVLRNVASTSFSDGNSDK